MKFLCFLILLLPVFVAAQQISLTKGMVIHHSVTIKPSTYSLRADTSLTTPLITIEGKNIVVDFDNAILKSDTDPTHPNLFQGVAILIKKGSANITLKNANIHGFKIAVLADSVRQLTIESSNFSNNYRQQMHSNWRREDISDWLSFHHNEKEEWLRYGAGIYLNHCIKAIIKNNTIINGQCALLMTNSDSAAICNNNFSFNSALGIGMYRSSYNHIYNNRLDFNVRGFSYGKYYRGQDSAGILVFEQCSNNVFAYNSVTHSGDGFFLWAGQYTMDTGEGGCNDNLLYNNDFSYAPTNGVELTFSRNDIRNNIIAGCDNGIWGGYSYQTQVLQNKIRGNKTAIAIEHGQYINVLRNEFSNNNTSIKLWSREKQPADWAYAQKRNTESKAYTIEGNSFENEKTVYDIMGTDSLLLASNSIKNCNQVYKLGARISSMDSISENKPVTSHQPQIKDTALIFVTDKTIPVNHFPYGRKNIRITSWGPYNFSYPHLFLDSISNGNYYFTVFHPNGSFKQTSIKGFIIIAADSNHLIAKADSSVQNRSIHLQYDGKSFEDMFGKQHAAGEHYHFDYHEFDPQAMWTVKFYQWTSANNPNKDYQQFFNALVQPVHTDTVRQIDYTWWGNIGYGLPKDSFATVATTTMDLPDKDYEISITGDELVKLFIDDKPAIDAWDNSYTLLDENTHHAIKIHLKGQHVFKLVQADIDGLADLMFYILPYK